MCGAILVEVWIWMLVCRTILVATLIAVPVGGGSFTTTNNNMVMMTCSQSIQTQSVEKNLHKRGFRYVIGSDEAGRGCIAGPVVVVSCCCLPTTTTMGGTATTIHGVDDCKNLSESERLRIFKELQQASPHHYAWTVAQASNLQIEQSNILRATMTAFSESIETLVETFDLPYNETYSIVDGKKSPKLAIPVPCRPWVKGDAQVYTVACASVIAKVTRDAIMKEANELFPEYGFDVNKGYPTRDHIQAIHTHGPCPLHRMSFKPLKGR